MLSQQQLRWCAIAVLVLASALNYLDRMVLNSLMPTLQQVFGISREQLGLVVSTFSIAYALSSPLMGLLIDRLGLRTGTTIVVALWSAVGIATGFTNGLTALLVCRGLLGVAEAGGIPASGKGVALYLPANAWAFGSALSQLGLTIGSTTAPLLTEYLFPLYGWRSAFVVSGAIGFLWIPLWLWISAKAPVNPVNSSIATPAIREVLSNKRFLALIAANVLSLTIYSLWTNWTTLFLVTHFGITREQANLNYAWIPPWFYSVGGLLGGWLALVLARRGLSVIRSRIRISLVSAIFALATGAAALAPTPGWAIAAICVSVAGTTALSVNYYSIPIDLFGPGRAAFSISFLTGVFGLMQAFLAPVIGRLSEQLGWQPVCAATAALPLVSVLILRFAFRREF